MPYVTVKMLEGAQKNKKRPYVKKSLKQFLKQQEHQKKELRSSSKK